MTLTEAYEAIMKMPDRYPGPEFKDAGRKAPDVPGATKNIDFEKKHSTESIPSPAESSCRLPPATGSRVKRDAQSIRADEMDLRFFA